MLRAETTLTRKRSVPFALLASAFSFLAFMRVVSAISFLAIMRDLASCLDYTNIEVCTVSCMDRNGRDMQMALGGCRDEHAPPGL